MMSVVRVLIVDDEPFCRATLRRALRRDRQILGAGEVDDGAEVVATARRTTPDVILLDLSMPNVDGVTATRAVAEAGLNARVLVVSGHLEAERVGKALAAGAVGYVSKATGLRRLPEAVRRVANGEPCTVLGFEPSHLPARISSPPSRPVRRKRDKDHPLSPREFTVAGLVVDGAVNREIAEQLGLSIKTIEGYRARAMEKLGVSSRAGLVAAMNWRRRRK